MKPITVYVSDTFISLLKAHCELHKLSNPDGEIDVAEQLARVVEMKARGICDEVIYMNTDSMWQDDIDTEAPEVDDDNNGNS